MEVSAAVNFKARLQRLIAYQDVFARNHLLAQRSCDQEFSAFLKFHNELRRKYGELRTYSEQMDHYIEQYRTELSRKDKKIQSQSSQILRLTQHNKRSNERLNELQRCLDQIKGTLTGQNAFDQLRDILRDSVLSDSETTTDLSDKNCTGEELDFENLHNLPKVVSQSTGVGGIKRPVNSVDPIDFKRPKHDERFQAYSKGRIVATTTTTVDMNDLNNGPVVITSEIHHEEEDQQHRATANIADQLGASPYSNIAIGRAPTDQCASPMRPPNRHSLSVPRPKQKARKPSKQWLDNKSEESELSTDDIFWSKHDEDLQQQQYQASLYPALPKLTSPPSQQQKTLTPSTPIHQIATPTSLMKSSPSSIGTLRARAHNFISRNILIPETCCVCLKRIHFGKLAYRCQACSALCHTGCKENCSTLCLPNVKTPNRGAVSKFTPREQNQLQVPALLVHCIKEIEQRGLQEVGIYRLNVVEGQVKELKERILKSRTGLFDLSHYNDIHLICGVVKDFLRSLSESLLTNALWKSFAAVIDEESDFIKQQNFDSLIQQLPKPNRDTLAFMILHLQRVAVAPLCRMPILNLSRTLGPAVVGYSSKHVSGIDIVGETYKQTKILEFFLKMSSDYWSKFLIEAETPEPTAPVNKQQIGTPILTRHHHYQNTPPTNCTTPANTFFSPL
ncbi:unnamed protein product [Rotaria magnacalcarata]|uniref:Rac GTPase-activating protein 1 n=1 Tax=Rotaria magnacalcarata TaxID=392030 RepID=A0A819C0N2_9BILA|nr:unnamed protein product [Rotaria magnacalcarata]CAF3805030.1 unnamed protein product [Rotaria magnacalcarata]CAF3893041.1 unnamed protein product [Rotaria magnacalcarata]